MKTPNSQLMRIIVQVISGQLPFRFRSLRFPLPVRRDRVRVFSSCGIRPSPHPSPGVPGEGG